MQDEGKEDRKGAIQEGGAFSGSRERGWTGVLQGEGVYCRKRHRGVDVQERPGTE